MTKRQDRRGWITLLHGTVMALEPVWVWHVAGWPGAVFAVAACWLCLLWRLLRLRSR